MHPEGSAVCHSTAHPEKVNHISIAKLHLRQARITTTNSVTTATVYHALTEKAQFDILLLCMRAIQEK